MHEYQPEKQFENTLTGKTEETARALDMTPAWPAEESAFVFEMTPDNPFERSDRSDELILTPSLSDERNESIDLTLEAGSIAKAEEITFDCEEELEARIEEAMMAYDEAMDQAAHAK